jgi:Zn ribbon nucleic-acid-binding protein
MSPRDHYTRAVWLGGGVFFGSGISLFALGAAPLFGGVPNVLWCVKHLEVIGVPAWLGFFLLLFAYFAVIITAAEMTRWAFRRIYAARCPECGAELAYWQPGETVVYVCRGCGHRNDLGFRDEASD